MYSLLGLAHLLIAIMAAPITVYVFLLVVPAWAVWLGIRMRRGDRGVTHAVRRTHYALLLVALLLISYGVVALRAAEESARSGGGLLGGFGMIPIAIGVSLALFSILTLVLTNRR